MASVNSYHLVKLATPASCMAVPTSVHLDIVSPDRNFLSLDMKTSKLEESKFAIGVIILWVGLQEWWWEKFLPLLGFHQWKMTLNMKWSFRVHDAACSEILHIAGSLISSTMYVRISGSFYTVPASEWWIHARLTVSPLHHFILIKWIPWSLVRNSVCETPWLKIRCL